MASAWAVLPYYDSAATAKSVLAPALRAAERALALDTLLGEAYSAKGYALAEIGDFVRAEPLMRRGAELSPRSAIARLWLGTVYRLRGMYEEDERVMRAAAELDPLAGIVVSNLAIVVGRDPARADEARALARRAIAVDPGNLGSLNNAATVLVDTRDWAESLDLMQRAADSGAQDPSNQGQRVVALVGLRQRDSALKMLRTIEAARRTPKSLEAVAVAAAALGDYDRAFAALDAAAQASGSIDFVLSPASAWKPVANDPRLRAACARTTMRCEAVLARVARAERL
jgi:tetratricopeptide (TPR) repeat protein